MSTDYNKYSVLQLRGEAKRLGLTKISGLNKAELIEVCEKASLSKAQKSELEENALTSKQQEPEIAEKAVASKQNVTPTAENASPQNERKYSRLKDSIGDSFDMKGIIQVVPEGFGFLKTEEMTSPNEYVYVSASQVQKFKLVSGNTIRGKVRPPKESEKYFAMLFVEEVNGTLTTEIIAREKKIMNIGSEKDLSVYEKSHDGILETNHDGFGFLRRSNYMTGENDIYVSPSQIRKYRLKTGDLVQGRIKTSSETERYDALLYVEKVNGRNPELIFNRPDFEKLVPIFPNDKMKLETKNSVTSTRIIDMFAPIGKGQRGMIVAPPKAGKTMIIKDIARAVKKNHPDIKLIILLIDERPEEVTDMQRTIDCDVVYSTFDQKPANHIKAAEIVLERAKRLVELGEDVVILVDSITRFARANNLVVAPSGRTLSGGLDPESLYFPKKFFGAARNIENGGSLTILATALVDTGSRMDDMIYEEFKGTGNLELHLERDLAEARIYPAINIKRSGTRREDLLLTSDERMIEYSLRKTLSHKGTEAFTDTVIQYMRKTESNEQLILGFKEKLSNGGR